MKRIPPLASKGGRVRRAAGLVFCLAALLLLSAWPLPAESAPAPSIALAPLGRVDPNLLIDVASRLRSSLVADVAVLKPTDIPKTAYYAPRRRFRGDALLDFLDRTSPAVFQHIVGITDRDISVTSQGAYDWGVMGVARLSGRPGVVSTFRLKTGSPSRALFLSRLEKVVLHELGHTLGLSHCPTPGCLMHDAEGSIRTVDSSTGRFCDACAARLARILR